MNVKPIIVFEGLDKVGKTSLAQWLSRKFDLVYDNFPSSNFPLLRYAGKHDHIEVVDDDGFELFRVKTTLWSRALSHALTHSLSYDWYRSKCEDPNFRGVVWDRYWYSAYAYNRAIGGLNVDVLLEIERIWNNPLVPDLVIFVHSKSPFGKLDNFDRENPAFRDKIQQEYMSLFLGGGWYEREKTSLMFYENDPNMSLEENCERLYERIKKEPVIINLVRD
jgi:thymidylate kinase